ncbi:MAG: sigma-70 family RNA polymerase sigma factor [Acidobacteriota bacterium]
MTLPKGDVTALLDAWSRGDASALTHLMEVVQHELHRIARRLFRRERPNHTLQPTAVVHEVYLKLMGQRQVDWRGRAEFFGVAAKLMRNVLVDHARRHGALKRGGASVKIPLDEALGFPGHLAPEVLALDDALIDLARRSPRQSRIVEMRVIVGLTLEEIAAVERISLSTVSRDWKAARLFLLRQLERSEPIDSGAKFDTGARIDDGARSDDGRRVDA